MVSGWHPSPRRRQTPDGTAANIEPGHDLTCFGWGTWIRTKDARVRAGSFTAKLSPKEARAGAKTPSPAPRNRLSDGAEFPSQRRHLGAVDRPEQHVPRGHRPAVEFRILV